MRKPGLCFALMALVSSSVSLLMSPPALAQEFPNPGKQIRILVGAGAGSGTDIMARTVADGAAKILGTTFIIENRVGASGNIMAEMLAKSTPDGYTISVAAGSAMTINQFLNPKPNFESPKDFTAICLLVENDAVLVVNNNFPAKTLPELIDMMKKSPGKYAIGSSGGGSPTRLGVEMLKKMTSVEFTDVFYPAGDLKGTLDVMEGSLPVYLAALISITSQVRSGQVRPLAVLGPQRPADFSAIPTAVEQGYPGYIVQTWLGVVGPANMPRDIVNKLNAAIRRVITDPAQVKKLSAQGSRVAAGSPEDFAQLIRNDIKKWGDIVPQLRLSQ